MKDIETKISPLVQSMFPSFYMDEGENFMMFVKAYYEWLEENHQLIQMEDPTNFNVGDTITQQDTTGTIVSIINGELLVRVNGVNTFKCYNVCSELILVTSTSGGSSYIKRGGTTRRLGTLFLSRNLLNIRDIDSTLDLFIVKFKEKYLKNIEFDVSTNKQLLVKNSLDLYRAKGTSRAVDLFFRLIYGVSTEVYYPGDDVFRLSDGEWVKPRYLEITGGDRAIDLVNKQITGVTSGATAFVEKYIKRKIKNGFVYVLYVSTVKGDFINNETLSAGGKIYDDSPQVVGSLTSVEIITGSKLFNVGDIVSFNSGRGDYGLARVASVNNDTGIVDFIFIDGGYGYTTSADTSLSSEELAKRTESIVSEKVLTLSNVSTSNCVSTFLVANAGSGYANGDTVKCVSQYANAVGLIKTNGSGAISSIEITDPGSGFYVNNPSVTITTSAGVGGTVTAVTKEFDSYFKYFENFTEKLISVFYDSASNNELLIPGTPVKIGNSAATANAYGVIISNANGTLAEANGNMIVSVSNNQSFTSGNKIYVVSNTLVTANVAGLSSVSATSQVMGLPNSAILTVGNIIDGTLERDDEVYQLNTQGIEVGNATIVSTSITGVGGIVETNHLKGIFTKNRTLNVRNKTVSANVENVQVTVGVYDILNNYSNTFSPMVFSSNTGTTANLVSVSTGSGASFRVGTISEEESIYLNTDLLNSNNQPTIGANQAYMTVPLAAVEYGFPKNPTGNSSAIIFSCLNFDSFTIGTIGSLSAINPGADYNVDPYILARQPYISGFNRKDYVIEISSATSSFIPGEKINQTNTSVQFYNLVVDNEIGFVPGETIYQGTIGTETAKASIVSISPTLNTIKVNNVTGTFTNGQNIKSYVSKSTAIVYNNASNNQLYANGSTVRFARTVAFAGNTQSVLVGNTTDKGYILLGTANTALYSEGDMVTYNVPVGGISLGGLTSGNNYYVHVVNSTAIQLRVTPDGTSINISSVPVTSENHNISKHHAYGDVISNANGSLANANGTIYVRISSGVIYTGDVIYSTSNSSVVSNVVSWANTGLQTNLTSSSLVTELSTAKGIIKTANSSTLFVKRIQFDNMFESGLEIKGSQSGATATIVRIYEDANTLPIGLNALIEANVVTANGTITSLDVIDSGAGYSNGEIMLYVSEDGMRAGEAKAIVDGIGTGSGYYKTSKGFLSSISKVHDGDYYQEYSYEILSRIPFDKYKDMYKKVMHTSGTRFFGGVLLEDTANFVLGAANSFVGTKLLETGQFNAATNVNNSAIYFDNDYANSSLKIVSGEKVRYYTDGNGNTAIRPLSNNTYYYAYAANSTSISLRTNPRQLSYTFNSNTDVKAGYANVRNLFTAGDYVKYTTSAGNTALAGLANNQNYYVVPMNNSTSFTLSKSPDYVYTNISNNNVVEVGLFNIPTANGMGWAQAFSANGHKMYTHGLNKNTVVHEYNLSTPWQVNTAVYSAVSSNWGGNTSLIPNLAGGMTFDPTGTKLYLSMYYGDKITEMHLTTPWSVNTATIFQTFDTAPTANSITFSNSAINTTTDFITYAGANTILANNSIVVFSTTTVGGVTPFNSNNGLFTIKYANTSGFMLAAYGLSSNYDFTTAGTGSFKVKTMIKTMPDIKFKPDGTKMFVSSNLGNTIMEYTLSTPWDISTSVLAYTTSNLGYTVHGMSFTPDGRTLLATAGIDSMIHSFTLSTPWLLSSMVADTATKSTIYSNTFTLEMSSDASKIYMIDRESNKALEYDWYTIAPSTISENGHTVAVTTINIQANVTASGTATNGHYIETANEI